MQLRELIAWLILQDLKISAPMKAVTIITVQDSQSTMNPRLPVVESPLQDTVTYQCIEKPMDTHHAPFTNIKHNDQVCLSNKTTSDRCSLALCDFDSSEP